MFKKWWNYIKAWVSGKSEDAMDPEIQLQMAIDGAKKQDQQLRSQAARVVAHRMELEGKLETAADEVGESREMAKQALRRRDVNESMKTVARISRKMQSLFQGSEPERFWFTLIGLCEGFHRWLVGPFGQRHRDAIAAPQAPKKDGSRELPWFVVGIGILGLFAS